MLLIAKNDEEDLKKALFDFIIRVASGKDTKPEEVAILPEILKLFAQ